MKMRKATKWISNIFWGIVLIFAGMYAYSTFQAKNNEGKLPSILGFSHFTILTGSMSPSIQPGDVILIKKPKVEDLKPGDIITFKQGIYLVTHRIVNRMEQGNEIYFTTKGDANEIADQEKISASKVLGKQFLTIPKLGFILRDLQTPMGIITLISIPLALLLIGNLLNRLSRRHGQGRI